MALLFTALLFNIKKPKIMKQVKNITAAIVTLFSIVSCQKQQPVPLENDLLSVTENKGIADEGEAERRGGRKFVYTLSNQVAGNTVMAYERRPNGSLVFFNSYAANGTGTGGGLGNQGAVILSDTKEILLAVNAGSNSISSFKVTSSGLVLRSTVNSGGVRPVSIAQHGKFVYVLNAGGNGNITGFRLGNNGHLAPIALSSRPLSSTAAGAAQISFTQNGSVLVVTEKATNKIITYTVNEWGMPGAMHSITSSTPTPFGFYALNNGKIFVSEAAGGAPGASKLSSYQVNSNGSISLLTGSVGANQSAACWVVITNNARYAYTTNTASNTLTSFDINRSNGAVSVNTAVAANTEMGPIDAALSGNSKFMYVLNGGSNSIDVFSVADNGGLSSVQTVSGLPAGANGLAAK
jgi:6-phosphogluconolactonase